MFYKFKESRDFRLNVLYAFVQGLYWMMVCCTVSLGSAYLSNRGYSTIGIGALLTVAYLFATILQQVISIATDNSSRFNVVDVLAVLGTVITVDLLFAMGTSGKGFGTGFTFLIGALVSTVIQPFVNALNFHIEKYKIKMNYGGARAFGSFAFFIISLVAGNLMKLISERVAPVLGFIISALFVAVIIWIHRELKATGLQVEEEYDPFEKKTSDNVLTAETVKLFIKKYRIFFVFLIGLVGYFFGHVLINNFIYQVVENVGGDEGSTGGLLAFAAILELPAMIFFTKLRDRFGCKTLLGFSAVFFFVKILMTALATSVGMLYFSMFFQAISFAVYMPASVHFADEIMTKEDAVKGQALITIAMTLGNLVSSLLGGVLIRIVGATGALWFGTIVTLCGVVVSLWALVKLDKNN